MWRLGKLLIMLAFVACAGWSIWWFLGAKGQEAGIDAWLENQRERGWQAEASAVEVTGFPLSFNMVASEVRLADPKAGWSWSAPGLTADSKAFKPTRIALTWPGKQTLAVPGERIGIAASSMTSLMDLWPGPSMELRETSGEIENLTISAQSGWKASAKHVDSRIAERPEDLAPPNSYDLRLKAQAVKLPKQLISRIDPTGWLKPSVDAVTVLGHAAFDQPLDRNVVEQGRLWMRAATIREAGFEWGDMRLVVKGSFVVDDDGFPHGEIEIEAREWRQMVRLAVSSGLIDRSNARTITRAVEFVTALAGSGDDLALPLGLSAGKLRIGPFAIAAAPRLAPPR